MALKKGFKDGQNPNQPLHPMFESLEQQERYAKTGNAYFFCRRYLRIFCAIMAVLTFFYELIFTSRAIDGVVADALIGWLLFYGIFILIMKVIGIRIIYVYNFITQKLGIGSFKK